MVLRTAKRVTCLTTGRHRLLVNSTLRRMPIIKCSSRHTQPDVRRVLRSNRRVDIRVITKLIRSRRIQLIRRSRRRLRTTLLPTKRITGQHRRLNKFGTRALRRLSQHCFLTVRGMTQLVTKGRFLSLMLTRFLRLVGALQRCNRLRNFTSIRVTRNQDGQAIGRLRRYKLTNAIHASSTRTITQTGRPYRVVRGLTTKGHRLTYDQNSANYDDTVVQVHYDDIATSNFAAHIRTAGLTVIDGLQVTTLDLNLLAHFLDNLSNFQRTNIRRTQIDRINSHRLGKAIRLQLNMRNISRVRTKDKHKRHHRVQISVNRTLQFFRGLHRISRVSRLFTRT